MMGSRRTEILDGRGGDAWRPASGGAASRGLADPLRIRLLEAMWFGPRSAKELAEAVGLPGPSLLPPAPA